MNRLAVGKRIRKWSELEYMMGGTGTRRRESTTTESESWDRGIVGWMKDAAWDGGGNPVPWHGPGIMVRHTMKRSMIARDDAGWAHISHKDAIAPCFFLRQETRHTQAAP